MKEELMLLGLISLLLKVLEGAIQNICIPQGWTRHMLPCKREDSTDNHGTSHFEAVFSAAGIYGGHRRLLSGGGSEASHCLNKGKVPLLSLEAIHQLHIFIFVLAVTHVAFSALTMLLGGAKIHKWKQWEESIQQETQENDVAPKRALHVNQFQFIRDRFQGIGANSVIMSWLHSFVKQFYGSVTKSDYTTMRLGFIMTHCKSYPKFDFHKNIIRTLQADFKKVVGISWYLLVFVFIFLLLNVNGVLTRGADTN